MRIQCGDLSVADIYGSDPLARVLIGRWRIRPLILALVFFFVGAVYLFLLSAIFGYLLPHDGITRSSLEDSFNQLNLLFIFPAVAFYYMRQPQRIAQVYDAVARYVPQAGGEALSSCSQLRDWHAKPRWWIPGVLFGLLGMGLGTVDNIVKLGNYWYAANWLMILILQLARGAILYLLITIAARHLAASAKLNRMFAHAEFPLTITSTTRNAGFQAITNYALTFAGIAAIAGLNLGLQPVLSTPPLPEYIVFVVAYFVLTPAGFFLPLWQARRRMVEIKRRTLDGLTERLQSEFERLMESLGEDKAQAHEKEEQISERLNAIRQAVELAEKSPTWPFQQNAACKLGATVIFPFVFAVLDMLLMFSDLIEQFIAR
jgi:hypothetical protein